MIRRQFYLAALACTGLALPIAVTWALDANVTATATFRNAITFGTIVNMDFNSAGGIDIDGGATPGTEELRLATNGDLTTSGPLFFTSIPATAQYGEVPINGTSGETVDIACSDSVNMERTGGNQIVLSGIEVHVGTGAAAGAATDCTGTGNNVATLTLDGTDAVRVGGRIVANSADDVQAGAYSTATATDPIVVRVVYQ